MFTSILPAGTLTFGGMITQSTQDGTGPAVNNPALNNVLDGDSFTVTFDFPGAIAAPGLYTPASFALLLADSTNPATENSFGSVSVSVQADATDPTALDISMLGCLTTGSGCLASNSLSVIFRIPAAGLSSQNVTAQALPGLMPLDLQEDDGITDIQGVINTYSQVSQTSAPEPSTTLPLALLAGALIRKRGRAQRARSLTQTGGQYRC
jgi:hypothetical protein